jgi:flagellar motor protein MotB
MSVPPAVPRCVAVLVWAATCAAAIPVLAQTAADAVIAEFITFLQADGLTFVGYDTVRTGQPSYTLFREKRGKNTLEEALAGFLYIYPNDYKWDATDKDYNLLRFPQGSYATMVEGTFGKTAVTVTPEGNFVFRNSDGKPGPNGHFGVWNSPVNFTKIANAWVFPDNFEVLAYEANRPGEWVLRNNTLAHYAQDVNDLVFTITYRPRARGTFDALRETVGDHKAVQLEQLEEGVRMTVAATLLFPSGSSDLSDAGRAMLTKVAGTLAKRTVGEIAVEGHTDNAAIGGALAKIYPTNWELSSARALAVVRFLASRGVPETMLGARAFGATRPRVPNTSEAGREQNRRIELVVLEKASR